MPQRRSLPMLAARLCMRGARMPMRACECHCPGSAPLPTFHDEHAAGTPTCRHSSAPSSPAHASYAFLMPWEHAGQDDDAQPCAGTSACTGAPPRPVRWHSFNGEGADNRALSMSALLPGPWGQQQRQQHAPIAEASSASASFSVPQQQQPPAPPNLTFQQQQQQQQQQQAQQVLVRTCRAKRGPGATQARAALRTAFRRNAVSQPLLGGGVAASSGFGASAPLPRLLLASSPAVGAASAALPSPLPPRSMSADGAGPPEGAGGTSGGTGGGSGNDAMDAILDSWLLEQDECMTVEETDEMAELAALLEDGAIAIGGDDSAPASAPLPPALQLPQQGSSSNLSQHLPVAVGDDGGGSGGAAGYYPGHRAACPAEDHIFADCPLMLDRIVLSSTTAASGAPHADAMDADGPLPQTAAEPAGPVPAPDPAPDPDSTPTPAPGLVFSGPFALVAAGTAGLLHSTVAAAATPAPASAASLPPMVAALSPPLPPPTRSPQKSPYPAPQLPCGASPIRARSSSSSAETLQRLCNRAGGGGSSELSGPSLPAAQDSPSGSPCQPSRSGSWPAPVAPKRTHLGHVLETASEPPPPPQQQQQQQQLPQQQGKRVRAHLDLGEAASPAWPCLATESARGSGAATPNSTPPAAAPAPAPPAATAPAAPPPPLAGRPLPPLMAALRQAHLQATGQQAPGTATGSERCLLPRSSAPSPRVSSTSLLLPGSAGAAVHPPPAAAAAAAAPPGVANALQALLEWQSLSHRVVTAAAAPNQATAWDALADDELRWFLRRTAATRGGLGIVAGAAVGEGWSRSALVAAIKQTVQGARGGRNA